MKIKILIAEDENFDSGIIDKFFLKMSLASTTKQQQFEKNGEKLHEDYKIKIFRTNHIQPSLYTLTHIHLDTRTHTNAH